MMKITVILCTYNRYQSLANALESVAAQKLPESVVWEVLVVDNNSTDHTRAVIDDFRRRHPGRFLYQFEPQPGKSYALNAAIRKAEGDVVAFMDDDVTVEPTWLQNLTAPLDNQEWAGAGGRIVLEWPASVPEWVATDGEAARLPLPSFDLGDDAKELREPPFGTNMAYRKTMFEKHGGFRTDLGPSPRRDTPDSCEDTDFGRRLLTAGERLRYEPSAVVHHPVPANRIDKGYFLNWWFDKGRGDVRSNLVGSPSTWSVAGVPLYLFRRIAVWTLRWMIAIRASHRFSCKLRVWTLAGEIAECYRQAHHGKTPKAQHDKWAAPARSPVEAAAASQNSFHGPQRF
jgi:glycosyltransferase involved in cell wall biosynthesis